MKWLASALVPAAALAAVLASPTDASGFCRARTVGEKIDVKRPNGTLTMRECERDESGCCTEGLLAFWRSRCVGYSMHRDGSRFVPLDVATAVVGRAFQHWSDVWCDAGGAHPSISARDLGPVACGTVGYESYVPNQHVIVFRDDVWLAEAPFKTIALTTVTYALDTGEIWDADMEINTANFKFSTSGTVAGNEYDLETVVTHEAGHFLGLSHAQAGESLMHADKPPGEPPSPVPSADDAAGICAIYHPDGTRVVDKQASATRTLAATACDPTPRYGQTTECIASTRSALTAANGCCTVAPGGGRRGDGERAAALLAVGGLALAARRRRR